ADLLAGFLAALPAHPRSAPYDDPYAAGLAVRRAVLGGAHVDRASAAVDDVTRDFQQLITRYAWGSVWARPGLDRRSRSMVTLTALVAHGHLDELAMHLRAAVTNGLSRGEIVEVLLQSALYCGVPAANSAFRVAQQVLAELDDDPTPQLTPHPTPDPAPSDPGATPPSRSSLEGEMTS
ncbi:MAG: 4-carboxymuconolactone decarboxylase, partial [Actinomycetota bacterium]|nr:4-carboxymuconolactone decarboxylase [Actinomycetota bacterium]